MTEYIIIGAELYSVATTADIDRAARALSAAGISEARVWVSPHPLEWIQRHGDPDAVQGRSVVFAVHPNAE